MEFKRINRDLKSSQRWCDSLQTRLENKHTVPHLTLKYGSFHLTAFHICHDFCFFLDMHRAHCNGFLASKACGFNNVNGVTLKTDSGENYTSSLFLSCQRVFSFIICVVNKVQKTAACVIQESICNNMSKSENNDQMRRHATAEICVLLLSWWNKLEVRNPKCA